MPLELLAARINAREMEGGLGLFAALAESHGRMLRNRGLCGQKYSAARSPDARSAELHSQDECGRIEPPSRPKDARADDVDAQHRLLRDVDRRAEYAFGGFHHRLGD